MARQGESRRVTPPSSPRAAGEEHAHGRKDAVRRIKRILTNAWGALAAAVVVLGGIAAIVAVVLGLLAPSPALTVSFDRLKVEDDVSLEEFDNLAEARAVARAPSSPAHSSTALALPYRLARAVAGVGSGAVTTTPATAEDTSTETMTTEVETTSTIQDTTTSTGSTNSTLAIPPSATPFTSVGGVPTREGTGAAPERVHEVAAALTTMPLPRRLEKLALPRECESSTCPATTTLIEDELAYHHDPAVAARYVARAFADSRGRVIDHKLHPIGAAVNYTIDLVGFAHQEAILVWSLWPAGGDQPLLRTWLRNVIAREVTPGRENETFSGLFWVPLPPRRGEYAVHLTLYTRDHVEHGEMATEPPFR